MAISIRDQDAIPVMVVGAGRSGLAAAMDLARFGVPCLSTRIIPMRETTQQPNRAAVFPERRGRS